MLWLDHCACAFDGATFDRVLELSDVSGPTMCLEHGEGVLAETLCSETVLLFDLFAEVQRDRDNVVAPLPER